LETSSSFTISQTAAEKTKRNVEFIRKHENSMKPFTVTILLKKGDDYFASASRPAESSQIWYSDEPVARAGQDRAPSPLSHFLSGMGFCQFVHYVEHCSADNIKIDSLEMKIDGTVAYQRPRRFTEITYEVSIRSRQEDETIMKLARAAAEDCFATNTLKRSCKVTGTVIHNGKKIDEHV